MPLYLVTVCCSLAMLLVRVLMGGTVLAVGAETHRSLVNASKDFSFLTC